MTSSGLTTISGDVSVVSGEIKTKIPAAPTVFIFTGRGWGHAVGMSQEGAKVWLTMATNMTRYLTTIFQALK